jgi:site-specific recombinase XerD
VDHENVPDQRESAGTFIPASRKSETVTRETVRDAWLAAAHRNGTRDVYQREIRRFFQWCDSNGVDVLRAERVAIDLYRQSIYATAINEPEPSTVAKKLAALSSFYRYGTQEHGTAIPDNPVARVRRPRVSRKSATAGLDADEVAQLIEATEGEPLRDRAVVLLLYATGIRASELRGAAASGLRTERGHLTLKVSRKGGEKDYVTIRTEAADALRVYLDGRSDGPLFIGVRGGAISRYEVRQIMQRVVAHAGIAGKKITPHSMRHTFATLALDAGADIRDVQEAMGHCSIETTMRYNRARSTVERAPTHALAWRN